MDQSWYNEMPPPTEPQQPNQQQLQPMPEPQQPYQQPTPMGPPDSAPYCFNPYPEHREIVYDQAYHQRQNKLKMYHQQKMYEQNVARPYLQPQESSDR